MDWKPGRQIREGAVAVIAHPKGNHRVVIYRRSDGFFDFEEAKFWDEENSWASLKKATATVADTFDRALEEVKGRVAWVKEL